MKPKPKPKRKRRAAKKAVDMAALRTECQLFHAHVSGVVEDLIDRFNNLRSEMADEDSPLRRIWDHTLIREIYSDLSNMACSLCSLHVPIPPSAESAFPDPLRLCAR